MPCKIVRNDLTKMQTEAIVNTANEEPAVGTGCDYAVYRAAGYQELLSFRKKEIGPAKEGDVFITPGFRLPAKYIIHAVSPLYIDGRHGEEELLRACYRKSLKLALWPLLLMSALFILVPSLQSQTSILIIPSGALAILLAWLKYRKDQKA